MAVPEGLGDLYELLGVAPTATDDEIKRAYRQRARELHPDANPGDAVAEAKFKEVSLAYEILRDPERRARYDRYGAEGVFGGAAGGSPFGFEGGLGDLFDAFFGSMAGGGTRRRGPQPGPDGEVVLRLEFSDAVFGAQRDLSARLYVTCTTCSGSGARAGSQPVRCTECQGTGELRRVRQSILGQDVTAVACNRCQGSGEMIDSPCADCRGEGRVTEDRTFTVEVPAGVENGSTLRLAGRGPAGWRGGPNGSLFVHLQVNDDPRFERVGNELHTALHVAMTQAALGADVELETLDGTETVTIAPGTQNGHIHRLRGLGVPHLRGRGRGDLHAHVVVDTPDGLSPEQQTLLRQLAEARGEAVGEHHGGVFSRIKSALS